MSFSLGKVTKKAISIGTMGLIKPGDISGSPGEASSSSAPNIGYLLNNKLQAPDYSFLMSPPKNGPAAPSFDFLKNYQAPTGNRGNYYSALMKGINAPSSVDAVRTNITGQQYGNLLSDIDRNTSQSLGSTATGLGRRGLINPGYGAASTIAGNALASVVESGNRDKANAGLAFQQNALDLQKAREDAQHQALMTGYQTEAGADQNAAGIGASQDQLYANLLSGNYNSAADRATTARNLYAQLLAGNTQLQNARDIAYATSMNSKGGTEAVSGLASQFLGGFGQSGGKALGTTLFA